MRTGITLINVERLYEAVNAVIRALEAVLTLEVVMDTLDAQARFIGLFDPVFVILARALGTLFPGLRVGAL